jgi:hypothetical protein
MSTRRNFFKYLGLAGGVAGGGIVAAAAVLPDSEKTKCIKEIESNGHNRLNIDAEYGELHPTEPNTVCFGPQFVPGTQKYVKASMTVGPDGEMYLMTNGKWRKIVTE